MSRADYAHWNEEADYMWWMEEGRHQGEPEYEADADFYPPEYPDDQEWESACEGHPADEWHQFTWYCDGSCRSN